MNTTQLNTIFKAMVAAGTPPGQAMAVALAIDCALDCPNYRDQCGTYMVDNLKEFVQAVAPETV